MYKYTNEYDTIEYTFHEDNSYCEYMWEKIEVLGDKTADQHCDCSARKEGEILLQKQSNNTHLKVHCNRK